jgi:hypothetical protein
MISRGIIALGYFFHAYKKWGMGFFGGYKILK